MVRDPKSSPRGSEDGGSFSPGTRMVFAQLPRVSYNLPGVNIPLSNARPPIHRMKFPFRRHHRHNLIIIDSHFGYWMQCSNKHLFVHKVKLYNGNIFTLLRSTQDGRRQFINSRRCHRCTSTQTSCICNKWFGWDDWLGNCSSCQYNCWWVHIAYSLTLLFSRAHKYSLCCIIYSYISYFHLHQIPTTT